MWKANNLYCIMEAPGTYPCFTRSQTLCVFLFLFHLHVASLERLHSLHETNFSLFLFSILFTIVCSTKVFPQVFRGVFSLHVCRTTVLRNSLEQKFLLPPRLSPRLSRIGSMLRSPLRLIYDAKEKILSRHENIIS